MNNEQIKAAESLKRALVKCTKVGLSVHALTEVGFYVIPSSIGTPESHVLSETDVQQWYADNGIDCGHPHLNYDGGAGV